MDMKVLILGATGLVGQMMIEVLEQRNFPISELMLVASDNKGIRSMPFQGSDQIVRTVEEGLEFLPDIALFSAGSDVSKKYARLFTGKGTFVIDNSSAWRMDTDVKLIVPEVNGDRITSEDRLIANPNCSTIQFVLVAYPLHIKWHIDRVVISTYQSVTGSGMKAVNQLDAERAGDFSQSFYPHPIDLNVLPHIDDFLDNGYSLEEMKMVNETRKILDAPKIRITATTVRVPVKGGHSESVNLEFKKSFELEEIYSVLSRTPGVVIQDKPLDDIYPTPIFARGKDDVFVGRIRRDDSQKNALNLWIVSDNLRKGAATNAVQIAETVLSRGFIQAG